MMPPDPPATRLMSLSLLRRSLFPRILALVLATLVVAQGINLVLLTLVRPPPPPSMGLAELTGAARADARGWPDDRLERELRAAPWPFDPRDGRAGPLLAADIARALRLPVDAVTLDLDPQQNGRIVHRIAGAALEPALVGHFVLSVRRDDGRWLVLHPVGMALFGDWQRRFLVLFLAGALLMLPAAWLFARRLAEPFRALALAAERLGRDPDAPPPAIAGTIEAQRAAAAFGEMARRLRAYVDDRTRMVGAIAHDLRTPLTRLAFRIEALEPVQREPMARDIAEMEAMVAATMGFVRGDAEPRARQRLELGSLVERVAEDMAVTGRSIGTEATEPLVIDGDPVALRRLFANLFDNGVKFGSSVRARAYRDGGQAVVDVDDDGPGLAADERERVFEPFHRAEPSRNRDTGGIGLGLSVVRTVARAHGGDVTLDNRVGGGLRARVVLPLAQRMARA